MAHGSNSSAALQCQPSAVLPKAGLGTAVNLKRQLAACRKGPLFLTLETWELQSLVHAPLLAIPAKQAATAWRLFWSCRAIAGDKQGCLLELMWDRCRDSAAQPAGAVEEGAAVAVFGGHCEFHYGPVLLGAACSPSPGLLTVINRPARSARSHTALGALPQP